MGCLAPPSSDQKSGIFCVASSLLLGTNISLCLDGLNPPCRFHQSVAFGSSSRKKWFGLPTLSTPVRCLSGCPLSPDVTTLFIVVTQSVPGCHWYSHSQSFQLIKQQLMHKLGHIICVVTLSNWVFLVLQQTPSSRRPDRG